MRRTLLEIRRAVLSYSMLGCLIVGITLLYQPEYYLRQMSTSFCQMDLSNAMQTTLGLGAYVMLATVLCTIPYATMYCWEIKTRYQLYAQHRQGKASYIVGKLCATAVSGGLAIMIPLFLFGLIQPVLSHEAISPEDVAAAWQECVLFFAYGAGWATLALGLSTLTQSPLVVLALPICIERGCQLLAVAFHCDWLRLSDAIAYQCGSVYTIGQIAVLDGLLFSVGAILFVIRVVKKEHDA